MGVREGDRVGIALQKSIDSVAAIFGIQKCGAVHVPVDATGPVERGALIFENCTVRAVIAEARLADPLCRENGRSRGRAAPARLRERTPAPLSRARGSGCEGSGAGRARTRLRIPRSWPTSSTRPDPPESPRGS